MRRQTVSKFVTGVLTDAAQGGIIVPLLRSALYDAEFSSFTVEVRGFEARAADGWFHPSTHPLWSERQLYLYKVFADRLVPEPFDPISVMTVTQGHFWHSLVEHVLLEADVLKPHYDVEGGLTSEVYVFDEATQASGHMDGEGNPKIFSGAFEFKSMNPRKFERITDLNTFRTINPHYWAQAQEYMRLSGYREMRVVILSLSYPFEMRELVIEYDHEFAFRTAEKYRRVLQAVADQRMPEQCCVRGSNDMKECAMRLACPVGLGLS